MSGGHLFWLGGTQPSNKLSSPSQDTSRCLCKGWECDRYTGAEPAAGMMQEQVSVLRAWGWDKTAALLETCSAFVKC